MLVRVEYSVDNLDLARIYARLLAREGAVAVLDRVPGCCVLRFRVGGVVLGREDYYAVVELVRAGVA